MTKIKHVFNLNLKISIRKWIALVGKEKLYLLKYLTLNCCFQTWPVRLPPFDTDWTQRCVQQSERLPIFPIPAAQILASVLFAEHASDLLFLSKALYKKGEQIQMQKLMLIFFTFLKIVTMIKYFLLK